MFLLFCQISHLAASRRARETPETRVRRGARGAETRVARAHSLLTYLKLDRRVPKNSAATSRQSHRLRDRREIIYMTNKGHATDLPTATVAYTRARSGRTWARSAPDEARARLGRARGRRQ